MTVVVSPMARPAPTRQVLAREGAGWLEQQGDRLVLHTQGTPYEEGYQHGRLLRDHVQGMWKDAFQAGFFKAHPLFPRWVWNVCARINERHFSPAERSELQGLAKGAGLSYQDVVLMNTEAPYTAPSMWIGHGCTQVVATASATEDGGTVVGRNLDAVNLDRTWQHQVVMVHHPRQGHAWLAPGVAGRVMDAVTGWNDQGLVIAQNDADNPHPPLFGLQSGAVMRRIMEQAGTQEEARSVVDRVPTIAAAGTQVTLVSAGKAEALEIQQTIGHHKTLGQRGLGVAGDLPQTMVLTNHYTSPQLAPDDPSTSSASRRTRAQELVAQQYGHLDVEGVKRILTDKTDIVTHEVGGTSDNIINWYGPRMTRFGPFPINPDVDVQVTTTYSTVADLDRGVLWVAGGKRYVDDPSDYQPLDVASELSRTAAD